MEKITKKAFKDLHSSKKIELIQGGIKGAPEGIIDLIEQKHSKLKGLKLSKYTLDNIGDYMQIEVFRQSICGVLYYFVVKTIDNSKNKDCSWDNMEVFTTVYRALTMEML